MRTTAIVGGLLLAIGVASCSKPYSFGKRSGPHLPKQETVFIRIFVDGEGNCRLRDKTPTEIRTDSERKEGPGEITWVISGTCPGKMIAITPEFMRRGRSYKIVTGLTSKGVPATDGQKIQAKVIPGLPDDQKKGHYAFTILIDGVRAHYNPPGDDGSFFLCPIWPCGDFEVY